MRNIKENSGESIIGVANCILGVGIVLSVVLGLTLLATISSFGSSGVAVIVFLVVTGAGCLMSWVISVFLRGFGEMVQYTAESATYLEAMDSSVVTEETKTAVSKNSSVTAIKNSTVHKDNTVYCTVCGEGNNPKSILCRSCGSKLPEEVYEESPIPVIRNDIRF